MLEHAKRQWSSQPLDPFGAWGAEVTATFNTVYEPEILIAAWHSFAHGEVHNMHLYNYTDTSAHQRVCATATYHGAAFGGGIDVIVVRSCCGIFSQGMQPSEGTWGQAKLGVCVDREHQGRGGATHEQQGSLCKRCLHRPPGLFGTSLDRVLRLHLGA